MGPDFALQQQLSTSLMLQPFNAASHTVVTPTTLFITFITLFRCYFITVTLLLLRIIM